VSDTEKIGAGVTRNKTGLRYWYRYKHPNSGKLAELTLFTKDDKALAEARMVFADLKLQRANGGAPELPSGYRRKPLLVEEPLASSESTVNGLVEAYLKDHA